jgi:sugar lactone lactonase YvrE
MTVTIQAQETRRRPRQRVLLLAIGIALAAALAAGTYLTRGRARPATQTATLTAQIQRLVAGAGYLAAGPHGDLYLTSLHNNRLLRLPGGSGAPASVPVLRPLGVAVGDRGIVYVAESRDCRIDEFTPSLSLVGTLATCGARSEGYDGPSAVAVGPDGRIYVTSQALSTIEVFLRNGAFLHWINTGGSRQSFAGMAVDATGTIYATDPRMNHIVVLRARSSRSEIWGGYGSRPGRFDRPTQIAVDGAGSVYILDLGNRRIQKLSGAGKTVASWGQDGSVRVSNPAGMTVDRTGAVYVTGRNGQVRRFSPAGK